MAGSELLQGQSEVFFNTPPIPPPLSTFARAEGGAAFCLGCPATGQPGAAEICYWLGKNACDEFRAPGTARWSKLMLRSEVEGVRLFRRWRAAASRSRRERVNRGQKPDEAPSFARRGERGAGGVSGGSESSGAAIPPNRFINNGLRTLGGTRFAKLSASASSRADGRSTGCAVGRCATR